MARYTVRSAISSKGWSSWTVCDPKGLPVQPVEEYLHWLRARACSENTIRSYGHHIAALFTWLASTGAAWDEVDFSDLSHFMGTYRAGLYPLPKRGGGERGAATIRAAAAAVREFYEYQRIEHGQGPQTLRLSRSFTRRGRNYFLAHIENQKQSIEVNRLVHGMPKPPGTYQIINFEEDFTKLLTACHTARDRLALCAFYDMGLRVGQVLGLRHGDLDVRRRVLTVVRRPDNVNGALSKHKDSFLVPEGHKRFFNLYRDYLLVELIPRGIESDYVFVNLQREPVGAPLTYSNSVQQCRAIGLRAGVGPITPHVLRHTHATALAKAGWTAAEIAKRLGQKSASSAEPYIHLAHDDIQRRLEETEHLVWPGVPGETRG